MYTTEVGSNVSFVLNFLLIHSLAKQVHTWLLFRVETITKQTKKTEQANKKWL